MIARLALVALLGATARAAEHPRVELEIDRCVGAPAQEVKRILAIDLGALLTDAPVRSNDTTHATIGCQGGLVALRVDDPITGKSLTRELDLSSTPAAVHARLLALAVGELISASWTELETNPHPAVQPVGVVASPAARKSALATVETRQSLVGPLRVVALASCQFFFTEAGALWGGGLRVGQDRGRRFAWAIDAFANHGSATTALGEVVVDTINAGPMFFFHHRWTRVALRVGGGLRGGAARLEGQPNGPTVRGAVAWSGWLGPVVGIASTVAPARRLALELSLEAGYVAVPFGGRVDGTRQVAIDGVWIGAQLGIGLFP